MALDGIAISAIAAEFEVLIGGRVDKVYMPERDEIVVAVRSRGNNYKLLLTSSTHPRTHFISQAKENPMQPPLFCMVLRKHLGGGRVLDVAQPNFERILEIHVESPDEMGDMSVKRLIIEIMGKHSNVILACGDRIIDSTKRVNREISSVREVLPDGVYERPPSGVKDNPTRLEYAGFSARVKASPGFMLQNIIYGGYSGISPIMATEICTRAGIGAEEFGGSIGDADIERIYSAFKSLMFEVGACRFAPEIIFDTKNAPKDFSAIGMSCYDSYKKMQFDSMSALLEHFYVTKDKTYRMSQKTADLRKLVKQASERAVRKKEAHIRTLRDIQDRDTLKLWGELLLANVYAIKQGMTAFTAQNYYDGSEIEIPLDPLLSPAENAQRYFRMYNKQKRTYTAVCEQMRQTDVEMEYLEGVLTSLNLCADEADVEEVREELANQGVVKKRRARAGQQKKSSKPLSFVSADGFEIFVGKNNRQNDELTLKFAESRDIWFHTKNIPGSHVIVRTKGDTPPESTLNEAANLAAYYSKARNGSHVPVDYTERRNVKKPSGAKPGMVIYDNYKTAYITPKTPSAKITDFN